MQELQSESKIIFLNDTGKGAVCGECERPRKPIWENNGFEAPEPEHLEFIGYERCKH